MHAKRSYTVMAAIAASVLLLLFSASLAVAQPAERPGQGQDQEPPAPEQFDQMQDAIPTGDNYSVDFRGCGQVRFLPNTTDFNDTIETNVTVLNTTSNNTTTFNLSFTNESLDAQDRFKFSTEDAALLLEENLTAVNASTLNDLRNATNATNETVANATNQTNETDQLNATNTTNQTEPTNATTANATNQTNVTAAEAELKIVAAAGIDNPNQCASVPPEAPPGQNQTQNQAPNQSQNQTNQSGDGLIPGIDLF